MVVQGSAVLDHETDAPYVFEAGVQKFRGHILFVGTWDIMMGLGTWDSQGRRPRRQFAPVLYIGSVKH